MARFHTRETVQRFGRALRYALGTWSKDDADRVRWAAQTRSGVFPLISLCTADVLEDLRECYGDLPPGAEAFAGAAAARVASKWYDGGDSACAALDWACDLAAEYAEGTGTPFGDRREDGHAAGADDY
jgi:hypothetical protein